MNRFLDLKIFAVTIIIATVFAVLLSGCSGKRERTEEGVPGGKVKVDTEKGRVEVETEEGKAEFEAGKGVELPEGFPEDFPIYENSELVQKVKVDNQGKEGYMLLFRSKDSVKSVADWYNRNLKNRGFKITFTIEQDDTVSLSFREASGKYEGSVQVVSSEEGSEIAVTIFLEK